MTLWRLSTVAPDLVQLLEAQDAATLSSVARRTAAWSVESVGLSDPRLDLALAAQEASFDAAQRAEVERLVEELDEAAWDVQERIDAGTADEAAYDVAFGLARAANAVWFAMGSDPREAALEAAYEAQAAQDSADGVRALITDALRPG